MVQISTVIRCCVLSCYNRPIHFEIHRWCCFFFAFTAPVVAGITDVTADYDDYAAADAADYDDGDDDATAAAAAAAAAVAAAAAAAADVAAAAAAAATTGGHIMSSQHLPIMANQTQWISADVQHNTPLLYVFNNWYDEENCRSKWSYPFSYFTPFQPSMLKIFNCIVLRGYRLIDLHRTLS